MRVELRPLAPGDAEISVRWRNDPAVWSYTEAAGRTGSVDVATERAWIERVTRKPDERRLAIVVDGAYVGNVYLTHIRDGSAQFHIFIGDRNVWGRGVGGRATAATIALGWEVLGLDRIDLQVHRENAAAIALYIRLGFAFSQDDDGEFLGMTLPNPGVGSG